MLNWDAAMQLNEFMAANVFVRWRINHDDNEYDLFHRLLSTYMSWYGSNGRLNKVHRSPSDLLSQTGTCQSCFVSHSKTTQKLKFYYVNCQTRHASISLNISEIESITAAWVEIALLLLC